MVRCMQHAGHKWVEALPVNQRNKLIYTFGSRKHGGHKCRQAKGRSQGGTEAFEKQPMLPSRGARSPLRTSAQISR